MERRNLSRRDFLRLSAAAATGAIMAACAPAAPQIVEVEKEVPVEKVVKETVIVEKEVVVEKPPSAYQGKFVILSCGDVEREMPMIEDIEAKHPGVKVEWRNLTSERYTELFAAADVAGDQIDIMDLNGQDLRRYAVGDKLIDLSDVEYLDRFRPVAINTYTVKGKLWAIPRGGISGWLFLYNKKAFEKVGVTEEIKTYDDLKEIAPELKKAGYDPVVHEGKILYMWPVWDFVSFAQTSKNQSIEKTIATLKGEMKFTDPEQVAALEIINRYARDGMFNEAVNSTDRDGAWLALKMGKAAIWGDWPGRMVEWREGDFPELDLSLMLPLQCVPDVQPQSCGGTGRACCIYHGIAPERLEVAHSILELMTNDKWVGEQCANENQAVSCNKDVQPSDDPLALKYAEECAPHVVTYLDWIWPPEITRAFQENEQAVVAGAKTPEEAAQDIQDALEDLYADGYVFED